MEFVKNSKLKELVERMFPGIDQEDARKYAEGFIAGSAYGFGYRSTTSFPNAVWDEYCKGNTLQRAQSLNPYNPLNEIED